ncbi:hypothetical protein Premu_0036 [Hallella multisaccharivorax DSM 17128]|uniref:Uncharacterized protein n=1 Tax=Hallella multisaccharivorax DSM 17128 TaxID=688246 RepID=F8N580_9BACT|nr:hypothetical protein Premu_0036 [Hallella multisaccharivorax DSM 17128]
MHVSCSKIIYKLTYNNMNKILINNVIIAIINVSI